MIIRKSYKYRLYPTEEQKEFLEKCFGCRRFVYNYFLDKRIKAYEEEEKTLSLYDTAKMFTELRKNPEYSWLKEVPSNAMRLALKDLDNAYKRFFKEKKGFPKFRSKYGKQTFSESQHIYIENNGLKIPKLKTAIPMRYHREHKGEIKIATITKTPTEKYYVSLSCKIEAEIPERNEGDIVGIDLGISKFLTLSNGVVYENHKYFEKYKKKLGLAQRHLARKKKGSNRYKKQKIKVAKIHEKIKNARKNLLHNVSCELTDNYHGIALEDLNIQGMIKNKKLSRAISDVSWSTFIDYLQYKSQEKGTELVFVDRFFASSKICSVCGHKEKEMPLNIRNWLCPVCNTEHDRDVNAALNILNEAIKISS